MEIPAGSSTVQSARATQIIAAAIAASVLLYMAVAWLVVPTMSIPNANLQHVMLMAGVLAVLSIGHLLVAQTLFAARVRRAEELPTPEQRLGAYRVAVILAFAIREAVAIYGLVLSFISGDLRWCAGFGAIALVSMLMGWPKRSTIDRLGSEVQPIG